MSLNTQVRTPIFIHNDNKNNTAKSYWTGGNHRHVCKNTETVSAVQTEYNSEGTTYRKHL